MKHKKKPKNTPEITVYNVGMMWQFERILGHHPIGYMVAIYPARDI
jgi:hypothetical protein